MRPHIVRNNIENFSVIELKNPTTHIFWVKCNILRLTPTHSPYPKMGLKMALYITYISPTGAPNGDQK
jgi:hypothetical protein